MNEHDQSLILPNDDHNQQLVANVHPSDWVNPEPTGRYNIVVIGAGTAGLITAVVAASLGAKVALIEKHLGTASMSDASGRKEWSEQRGPGPISGRPRNMASILLSG